MAKATTAPKAAPKASAAPGTEDKKAGKKAKVQRKEYPGLFDADGAPQKLTAVPTDFDSKLHKPLKRTDFADESMYLEMKADEFAAKADKLRKEAQTIRELGSSADRKNAKKLIAMQEKMAELMESLKAQGIDPEAILSKNA